MLERLDSLYPRVKPMFGCFAIYVAEKMVMILRNRKDHERDNGVWIATSAEHHADLKKIFPAIRSVQLLGPRTTAWQNIPAEAEDFEESVMRACELVLKNDPRIGKIPKQKNKPVRKR